MTTTLVLASHNKNKVEEIRSFISLPEVRVVDLDTIFREKKLAINAPEVEETEDTYLGNATLKADAIYRWSGQWSLADDSGIEITALGNSPGVFSARFGGDSLTHSERNQFLLNALTNCSDRTACFRTILCLRYSRDELLVSEGMVKGTIAPSQRGLSGWGYEPLFIPEGSSFTVSELREQGHTFNSHRHKALQALVPRLQNLLEKRSFG